MTEKTNDFPITKMEQDQKAPQGNDDSKPPSAEMWEDFLDSTTLHGIRFVFLRRQTPIRLLWLVLLLTAGGYYMFTVYRAVDKYYSRPFNTVLSTKHVQEMEFPAVTICPLSKFSRRKIFMIDDDPLFVSSGLNISSCAVTSRVRGNRPCGWSLLCCCSLYSLYAGPNCTRQYQQELLAVMQTSGNRVNLEELYMTYSHDVNALLSPSCLFISKESIKSCSAEDFVPMITTWGRCYTFNSGTDGKMRTERLGVIDSGFKVTLDAQTHDYYAASFLVGFKVLVHGQGEYANSNKGTNVGPGQQALIALSQKRFKNLEKPYATNCSKKSLRTFSTYTLEGCLYDCLNEKAVKRCKCRLPGFKGDLGIPVCTFVSELPENDCLVDINDEGCDCQVPCAETKYYTEVSYSKFTDTMDFFKSLGYTVQYQRENLVSLDIGFKSLTYEMEEQQPAYDQNSLFGEIGGNMGLFLGCSLLTIFEFFDFLVKYLAARKCRNNK